MAKVAIIDAILKDDGSYEHKIRHETTYGSRLRATQKVRKFNRYESRKWTDARYTYAELTEV